MKFKSLFVGVFALIMACFVFTACGDDNSTSASSEKTAGLVIDYMNKKVTLSYPYVWDECLTDSLHSFFKWEIIKTGNYEFVYSYFTVNDTLILEDKDGSYTSYTVLVGGNPSTLQGNWSVLDCDYDNLTEIITCDENGKSGKNLTVSENSVTFDYNVFDDSEEFNLSTSYFMVDIFDVVAKGYSNSISVSNLWFDWQEAVEDKIESYYIEVLSASSENMSFKVGRQKFDVTVSNYTREAGRDAGYNTFANVTVTSNGNTCRMDVYYANVEESQCNMENSEYLKIDYMYSDDFYEDGSDDKVYYAYVFDKSNEEKFETCLLNLAGYYAEESDNVLAKKSSSVIFDKRTVREAQNRLLNRVSRMH